MEVVVTTGDTGRAKIRSNHHHQQTNTQCFTGRMPFLSPNQPCQSTEGEGNRIYIVSVKTSLWQFLKVLIWVMWRDW